MVPVAGLRPVFNSSHALETPRHDTNGLCRSRMNDHDLGSNERDFSRTKYLHLLPQNQRIFFTEVHFEHEVYFSSGPFRYHSFHNSSTPLFPHS